MKKVPALALTLALCLGVAAPALAAEEQTPAAPSVFTDVAADRWSYDVIRYCHEQGLVKGTGEDRFDPTGTLTVGQALALAARLHRLTHPSTAPDAGESVVRFLAEDGSEIASYTWDDLPSYNAVGQLYVAVSDTPGDSKLPETCTMELSAAGCGPVRSFQGKRESHTPPEGVMSQGLRGTGYRFEDETAATLFSRWCSLGSSSAKGYQDAWWYSDALYLSYAAGIDVDGGIVYRLLRNDPEARIDAYDPTTGFDSDPASRALFAWLLDQVIDGELAVINDVSAVPDVAPDFEDAAAILRLYGAGIVTGVDQAGNFCGGGELTREQAAAMLARVLKSELRQKI